MVELDADDLLRYEGRYGEVNTDGERGCGEDGKTRGVENRQSDVDGVDVGVDVGVFKEWYGSEDMLKVSMTLMGCEQEDMQFGESGVSPPS